MVSDERLLPNGVLADSDNEFIMVNSFLPSDEKQLCGGERVIPAATSTLPIVRSVCVCVCVGVCRCVYASMHAFVCVCMHTCMRLYVCVCF